MKAIDRNTAELGELVVAVFDAAAIYSTDPREVSRLATQVIVKVLARASAGRPFESGASRAH